MMLSLGEMKKILEEIGISYEICCKSGGVRVFDAVKE
jgi:hypothetical protein